MCIDRSTIIVKRGLLFSAFIRLNCRLNCIQQAQHHSCDQLKDARSTAHLSQHSCQHVEKGEADVIGLLNELHAVQQD
jgi:hypothetical protein